MVIQTTPLISSIFYTLRTIKCEVSSFFHALITKTEFKNPSSTSAVIKWKTDVCMLYFFIHVYNVFSFETGFSLEPLYHTKRLDKYIFTHLTSKNVRLTFCMTKWVWVSPLSLTFINQARFSHYRNM